VCAGNLSASISENQRLENFDTSPLIPLPGRGGEGEKFLWGHFTQGGARSTSLALGYYLSGFQPCESVSIGVYPWFPSPLHFAETRKLFCPERAL
jgi:hypothetical protein